MHPQVYSESSTLSFLLSPIPRSGALLSLSTIFDNYLMAGQWNRGAPGLSHSLGHVRVVDGFTIPSSSLDSTVL